MGVVELAEVIGPGDGPGGAGAPLVAIKRILPELARDEGAKSMFLREARLLSRLDCPQVVRVVEVDPGDDEAPAQMVLEFVDGPALVRALGEPLPVGVAASVARDAALGLHAAHELRDEQGALLGVVHRDVSPHNLMLTFDGTAKLLDFGVAKTRDGGRTATGEVKGKLAYMAPEQAMCDPVDRRSDLYALGAVLYEALSGKRMHGEGSDLEILKRMASGRPPALGSLRPELPAELLRLVDSMTAPSPDERPATALAVAQALAPFASEPGAVAAWVAARFPRERERQSARVDSIRQADAVALAPRPPPPRVGLALGLAAVALLAAGALALRPPPPLPLAALAPSASAPAASAAVAASAAGPAAASAPASAALPPPPPPPPAACAAPARPRPAGEGSARKAASTASAAAVAPAAVASVAPVAPASAAPARPVPTVKLDDKPF